MNLLAFALAAVIVIASTTIVITQMGGIFLASRAQNNLNDATDSLKRLDMEIRDLGSGADSSQKLVRFRAGDGTLIIRDDTDTVEYRASHGSGGAQNFTEGNINFIYGNGNITLRVTYAGYIDITGNASRSGTFSMSMTKNPAGIQISIV